jgi:hypothetical protein
MTGLQKLLPRAIDEMNAHPIAVNRNISFNLQIIDSKNKADEAVKSVFDVINWANKSSSPLVGFVGDRTSGVSIPMQVTVKALGVRTSIMVLI